MVAFVAQSPVHLVDGSLPRGGPHAPFGQSRCGELCCVRGERGTAAPCDVGVGSRRQQRQEGLDDRIVPPRPSARARSSAGARRSRMWSRSRRVLARDAVTIGRQPHRLEERHGRVRPATSCVRRRARVRPARPGGSPRTTSRASSTVVSREDSARSASRVRAPPAGLRPARECRARERREQEDDAEVGVGPRPARRRFDSAQDRRAERPGAGARQRVSDRRGAGQKVLVARIAELPARARRCRVSARSLRAGTRAARPPRRQRRTACRAACGVRSPRVRGGPTIAPATSSPVARCSPCQPGMPLTSSTNTEPSRDGSRSTPA